MIKNIRSMTPEQANPLSGKQYSMAMLVIMIMSCSETFLRVPDKGRLSHGVVGSVKSRLDEFGASQSWIWVELKSVIVNSSSDME